MKRFFLGLVLCTSLTACSSTHFSDWPDLDLGVDWASLNPFDREDVTEVDMTEGKAETEKNTATSRPVPRTPNQSALQTELDEMERLTGNRPQAPSTESETRLAPPPMMAEVNDTPPTASQPQRLAQVFDEPVSEPPMAAAPVAEVIEEPMMMSAEGCPQVRILPSAKSITNFEDGSSMSGQVTSRATITDIRGGCEVVSGGLELDLDILMRGTITNQGRFEGDRNVETFQAFPYFILVTDARGQSVDKQITATAMRFRPGIDFTDHAEKITQFIPMRDTTQSGAYTITVGYQLSRAQLEFNRAAAAARPNDTRVSPDTSEARRRSFNPLSYE